MNTVAIHLLVAGPSNDPVLSLLVDRGGELPPPGIAQRLGVGEARDLLVMAKSHSSNDYGSGTGTETNLVDTDDDHAPSLTLASSQKWS